MLHSHRPLLAGLFLLKRAVWAAPALQPLRETKKVKPSLLISCYSNTQPTAEAWRSHSGATSRALATCPLPVCIPHTTSLCTCVFLRLLRVPPRSLESRLPTQLFLLASHRCPEWKHLLIASRAFSNLRALPSSPCHLRVPKVEFYIMYHLHWNYLEILTGAPGAPPQIY